MGEYRRAMGGQWEKNWEKCQEKEKLPKKRETFETLLLW
jgi:hypothetical protein